MLSDISGAISVQKDRSAPLVSLGAECGVGGDDVPARDGTEVGGRVKQMMPTMSAASAMIAAATAVAIATTIALFFRDGAAVGAGGEFTALA